MTKSDQAGSTSLLEYLELFNQIEDYMKRFVDHSVHQTFVSKLVAAAKKDARLRSHSKILRLHADLRNVLAHDPRVNSTPIAIPSKFAIAELERIVLDVTKPPMVYPRFARKIHEFESSNHLSRALEYMKTNDYSQILVRCSGVIKMLSVEGISAWMRNKVEDDLISLQETVIEDALQFEPENGYKLIKKNASLLDASMMFAKAHSSGMRLYALIITDSGKADQHALGVITPWDFMDSSKY